MNTILPGNISISPKQEALDYILHLFNGDDGGLKLQQIVKLSKLTKTQTLNALKTLVGMKLIVQDQVGNIFYLL